MCIRHGAKFKRYSSERCTNLAKKGGALDMGQRSSTTDATAKDVQRKFLEEDYVGVID